MTGPSAERRVVLPAQVPDEATAVVLNVTGVSPTAGTFLTLWPSSAARPEASNLNLRAGEVRANAVTVALGGGAAFYRMTPLRVIDTRFGEPLPGGWYGDVDLPGGITQIAAGFTTAYALRSDGTVWAWGSNGGSLSNASTAPAARRPPSARAAARSPRSRCPG
jgi:hypothetical protein